MNHNGNIYVPLNNGHSSSMSVVPLCTNKKRNVVPLQPEDEEVLNIIYSICDNSYGDYLSEPLSFGPRCARCGMPCGNDAIYFGTLTFHKRQFNCKICGSSLDFPIVINDDLYCKSCVTKMKKKGNTG